MLSIIKYKQFISLHRNLLKEIRDKVSNQQKTKTGEIYREKLMDKMPASIPTSISANIILPHFSTLKLINGKFEFSYEALPFFFNLDGHDKNLLLFLLTYCIEDDCTFVWNRMVALHYADFYDTVTPNGKKRPTLEVIRQSVYSLIADNVIQKKETEIYMLNPLFYPTTKQNQYNRRELIKTYVRLGVNKRKATIDSLFDDENKK